MDLRSAIEQRRMVRSFSEEPISEQAVEGLLELALRSPSAGNSQGLSFVVLSGPDQTQKYWDATTTPSWRASSRRWLGFSRAPVVAIVLSSPDRYVQRYSESDKSSSGLGADGGIDSWPIPFWFFDAGAAVMAMLPGAIDQGIGACFLGNFRGEAELLASIGVHDARRLVGAVLLGRPDGQDAPSQSLARGRTTVAEAVHWGEW